MIDYEWYRSFVAVYQTGTVSAAARHRFMTQPGISQHIAALEHALETRLFERTPRQMVPTPAGQRLYTQVIGAVEQLDRLSMPAALDPGPQVYRLRVGAPREFFYAYGLTRLNASGESNYEVNLSIGQTVALIRQLEAQALDVVVATQRITRRGIHYVPLCTEHFVLVAPPTIQMPLELSRVQVAEWLESQPWISYAPDLPIIRRYWQEVFERRPNVVPRLILPDLLMIVRAVCSGMGISVLPEYLCREALQNAQLHVLWRPPHDSANQLYLACLRDRLNRPEITWFTSVMRSDIKT